MIETPIAVIIKYRDGAFLSLKDLYANLSFKIDITPVIIAANIKDTTNGKPNIEQKRKPQYAPNIITAPWAKLLKFKILKTRQ